VNKVFAVVRREFIERVRTRAFIITTFLLPIVMVGFMVLPVLMMTGERTQRLAIVDGTIDSLGARIEAGFTAQSFTSKGQKFPSYSLIRVSAAGRVAAVRDSLVGLTGYSLKKMPTSFDGVLVLTDSTFQTGEAEYLGGNVGGQVTMQRLQRTLSSVLTQARLVQAGVNPAVVGEAVRPANISTQKVTDGRPTGQSGEASFALGYVMGFILYMAILLYGQQTASSVIEEKTSRIMEIIASSLRPFQMLLGKIIGVGATGLFQLSIWGATLYVATSQRGRIAGLFGVDPSAVTSLPIPSMPADVLVVFLTYFALGFLIYGAIFAAVGSMVNSIQEMQQTVMPVTLLIVVGFFGMFNVINDPNASLGAVFSFIPFFAPFVMPVRFAMSSVPVSELAASIAAMIAGVLAVAWLAGRIYRTGILMYGKKPTFGEVFRWIRTG
jgi:ABC-2 type transport system permease protein